MFLISFSIFWSIFSDSSRLSPRNCRWGMRMRSFFFWSVPAFSIAAPPDSPAVYCLRRNPFSALSFARGGFFSLV